MSNLQIIERLRRGFWAEKSDADLLAAFVARHEHDAFCALVERYGPLVWSVCRRQLGDSHLAEDGTQATFLTLVRQSPRVRSDSLAAWLVSVAKRICRKSRLAEARRKRRESVSATLAVTQTGDDLSVRELMAVLDEEVSKLPYRYRSALLACYWQGLQQSEAARRQGITPSALKGLLERGREKLLARLRRRGLTADVALRGLLVAPLALVALPGDLLAQTIALANGPVPPSVAALIPTVGFLRWGTCAVASIALSVGVILVSGAMPQQPAKDPPPISDAKSKPRVDRLGDALPDGALLRLGTTRFRHPNSADALALSPNGKVVVTTGSGKMITWDAETGKEIWRKSELARSPGSSAGTHPLAFSSDGKHLVTPGAPGSLAVWDVATGQHRLMTLKGTSAQPRIRGGMSEMVAIELAPDGKSLTVGTPDAVLLCDMEGNIRHKIPNSPSGQRDQNDRLLFHGDYSLGRYSPDGKTLALTGNQSKILRLCNPANGEERLRIELQAYMVRLAFAPDGKQVAVTERDNAVRVYDTVTGKRLHSWVVKLDNPYENYTSAVAFSPDGKLVAAGATDHLIRLWDVTTGKEVGQLKGTGWYPWGLAFSPDGKTLYSTGWDGVVRRWDVAKRTQLPLPQGGIRGSEVVAAAPNGQILAYADDDDALRLVDAKTGQELQRLKTPKGGASRLAFSSDSRLLAAGGSHDDQVHVVLWDIATEKVLQRWDWEKGRDPHSTIEDIVVSPDGKQIAVAVFRQSEARILEIGGQQQRQIKHPQIYGLDFAPDGATLATVGWDKAIRLWNPATGEMVSQAVANSPQFQDSRMYGVRYSPDGRLLATAMMMPEVFIWDAKTLSVKNRIQTQGSFIFNALAFSPDGLRLATGDNGGRVRVWDTQTGAKLWDRGEHGGYMYVLSFGRDSRTLLAGGNGLGYLWGLRPANVPKKELPELWNDLTGTDSVVADRAFWAFLDTPEETVKLFAKNVQPKRVESIDAARASRLIADLDDEKFSKREAAQTELANLGRGTLPHLKEALGANASAEKRQRLTKLIERLVDDEATVQRFRRIVSVLRHVDTPSSKELLRDWANIATDSLGELASKAMKDSGR